MFEPGSLLLVPFPFSDGGASKRRPVLALTSPDSYGDFVALPVTSRGHQKNLLALAASDLAEGNLPRVSWVRTDRVVTLNVGFVIKSFGKVTGVFRRKALDSLCAFVDRGAT